MVCSNCGHPLGPDDQYCGGCGAFLTDAPEDELAQDQAQDQPEHAIPDHAADDRPAGDTAPQDPLQDHRWDAPAAQQPPRSQSRPSAWMVAAAVAAVGLVALLVFWVLRPDGADVEATDQPTAATTTPAATDGATDTASPAPTDTPTDTPTASPTTEPPPATPIDLPGSAEECSNVGSFVVYRGNTTTSCPFAENVGRAFAELEQPVTAEVTLSGVASPVTGLDYDLACEHTTPVRCTGGDNAAVYLVAAS